MHQCQCRASPLSWSALPPSSSLAEMSAVQSVWPAGGWYLSIITFSSRWNFSCHYDYLHLVGPISCSQSDLLKMVHWNIARFFQHDKDTPLPQSQPAHPLPLSLEAFPHLVMPTSPSPGTVRDTINWEKKKKYKKICAKACRTEKPWMEKINKWSSAWIGAGTHKKKFSSLRNTVASQVLRLLCFQSITF